MSDPIRSRPYSTAAACERCCFGRGEHAEFCSGPPTPKPEIANLDRLDIAMRKMEERGSKLIEEVIRPKMGLRGRIPPYPPFDRSLPPFTDKKP